MIVRTIQLAKWRKCKELPTELIDASIKSGQKLLAPTKELLYRYKYHNLSEAEYTKEYLSIMRDRFRNNPEWFYDLCHKDDITLACYCAGGSFCHRYILVEILRGVCMKIGVPFEYLGEVV